VNLGPSLRSPHQSSAILLWLGRLTCMNGSGFAAYTRVRDCPHMWPPIRITNTTHQEPMGSRKFLSVSLHTCHAPRQRQSLGNLTISIPLYWLLTVSHKSRWTRGNMHSTKKNRWLTGTKHQFPTIFIEKCGLNLIVSRVQRSLWDKVRYWLPFR
jgi:hypothetical protein